jgi:hypothetical protein
MQNGFIPSSEVDQAEPSDNSLAEPSEQEVSSEQWVA